MRLGSISAGAIDALACIVAQGDCWTERWRVSVYCRASERQMYRSVNRLVGFGLVEVNRLPDPASNGRVSIIWVRATALGIAVIGARRQRLGAG